MTDAELKALRKRVGINVTDDEVIRLICALATARAELEEAKRWGVRVAEEAARMNASTRALALEEAGK